MVRSRSETNLNNIFLDLCTSAEIRKNCEHLRKNQRRWNPPLPTLTPIKSSSCSDLTKISQDYHRSSFVNTPDDETLDLITSPPLPTLARKNTPVVQKSSATPLIPMESTGFTIQRSSLINSDDRSSERYSFFRTESYPMQSTCSYQPRKETMPLTTIPSDDKKEQDYTHRLSDRLKARRHLRNFFLS